MTGADAPPVDAPPVDAPPVDAPPAATIRWRIDVRYDGTGFSGWASQPGRRTVQGELELWLVRALALSDPPRLVCAGRTDSGVHARGQVVHVDLPAGVPAEAAALLRRLRRAMPADVAVTSIAPAPPGFDARFAAIWRRYCYRIADQETVVDPLRRGYVTEVPRHLDLDVLNAAAATLLGLRDFGAFCRRREGATTVRTLLELGAVRADDGLVEVAVRADAFCHSMVRCLVGALVEVAAGRRTVDWLSSISDAAVRSSEVPVMPAHGLTLEQVGYPPDDQLAARAAEARTLRTLPSATSSEEGAQQ